MKLDIKVSPTEHTRHWVLLESITYEEITVPAGFIFDGASIPVGLRPIFPHGGAKFFASCIHDYAYKTGVVSKERADALFLQAMLENGVEEWKANTMYAAVKLFGSSHYKG